MEDELLIPYYSNEEFCKIIFDFIDILNIDQLNQKLIDMCVNEQNICFIDRLIKKGADPNIFLNGQTPLHMSCMNGLYDITEHLLKIGGSKSINVKDSTGNTPIHLICIGSDDSLQDEFIEMILRYCPDADFNIQNNDGNTSLHLAYKSKLSEEFMELLISNGADPKIKNNEGKIPSKMAKLVK